MSKERPNEVTGDARAEAAQIVLRAERLGKVFTDAGRSLEVLRGIDFELRAGDRLAIIGASGSGKTTLLQLLGGLDQPTAGRVIVAGQAMNELDEVGRGRLRNRALGFVYQFHHLLPEFTALENVAMPLLVRGAKPKVAAAEARDLLDRVGLAERLDHRPGQLSGGERQRTAVARALVTRPAVVLADEPTGNLDRSTGKQIAELIFAARERHKATLFLITHDPALAALSDETRRMSDGQLAPETRPERVLAGAAS
jgi:lipoprotein-releasing system ATP-binding protein